MYQSKSSVDLIAAARHYIEKVITDNNISGMLVLYLYISIFYILYIYIYTYSHIHQII